MERSGRGLRGRASESAQEAVAKVAKWQRHLASIWHLAPGGDKRESSGHWRACELERQGNTLFVSLLGIGSMVTQEGSRAGRELRRESNCRRTRTEFEYRYTSLAHSHFMRVSIRAVELTARPQRPFVMDWTDRATSGPSELDRTEGR